MNSYQVYGHTIHINIALNLQSIRQQLPDYTIFVKDEPRADQRVTWIHNYDVNCDNHWFRLGKISQEYLLCFVGLADFLIDEKKKVVNCFPGANTQLNSIEHLLLDQVLPRMLSRKESLVLHAGAVTIDGGAIGFLGHTGRGKSTLAAFFGQHGHSILTDDCLVLRKVQDKFHALPSYPAIRLKPEMAAVLAEGNEQLPHVAEYTSKLRLDPAQGSYVSHAKPETLRALLILADPERYKGNNSISIKPCSRREAFSKIIESIFRLDPTDKHYNIREFDTIYGLVSTVPVFQLAYARQQSELKNVMQATLEMLSSLNR